MARISELHYSNAYANSSGIAEFLEVALQPSEDPADFTVSFYQANGTVGEEIGLDHPDVQVSIDPDNGEVIYVISADYFNIRLTDPDGGGSNNYEAYALTDSSTMPVTVVDFYDIGGGTQNITAVDGLAAGATSDNLAVLVGPNSTTTTLQFNQPNPDTLTHDTESSGDTGIACFVEGTMIETPEGPITIEDLHEGMQVLTRDAGAQSIRWIGSRTVMGQGDLAPIRIESGNYGATAPLFVSPQHRILVEGWQAELLFGEVSVLVPAKALINDRSVRRVPVRQVTYFHLMLASHQIVTAHGVESESFYPGVATLEGDAELVQLFPDLAVPNKGYGSTARPTIPVQQARLLVAA